MVEGHCKRHSDGKDIKYMYLASVLPHPFTTPSSLPPPSSTGLKHQYVAEVMVLVT